MPTRAHRRGFAVCAVKEGTVVIETGADRVRLEMTKESIATRFTKDAKSGESK